MNNTLSLRLLGTPDIRSGDQPIKGFVSSKAQALLIYLVVTQRRCNRATLATLFWGDLSETAARRNLTKVLTNLRQLVGEHLDIDRYTVSLSLNKEPSVDVIAFEQHLAANAWAEMAALYNGDFLQGFHVANAPDFEAWMIGERERLHHLCCQALARLAGQAAYAKDLSQAISWSQQLLRLDPTDEKTHRQLMTFFVRNGQRNSALAQYAACRTIVERELDVAPAPETEALYRQILNGQGMPPASNTVHSAPPAITPPTPVHAAPLIGRDKEWRRLLALGQETLIGRPHLCLIHGEAGLGKTRLAEEMLTWAGQNDVATARTRAYAAAGELAYAPIVDWLRSPPLQPALAALDEVWLKEIARLLPELMQEHPQWQNAPTAGDGPWQRQRLFDALTRAFQAGPRPKVLLLDDLQWCDGETVAWLHYFLQASQQPHTNGQPFAPTFIIGTARPEIADAAHPLYTVLLHLRSDGCMTELGLPPLDNAATGSLANQTIDSALTSTQAENLFRYTEGNPLFVIESIRADGWQARLADPENSPITPWPSPPLFGGVLNEGTAPSRSATVPSGALPPKMQAVIQERLAQLSPHARTLAGLAAVIGRSFSFALLQKASAEISIDTVVGLDELWQKGIVRAQGYQQYDFSHDRIREVAYLSVSPVQRPLWHGQAARALESVNAADLAPVSAQLAFHYEQAGDLERAVAYYQRAAEWSHAIFADADAVSLGWHTLDLIAQLPDSPRRQELELATLIHMRDPIIASQGYPEALYEISMRAKVLCETVGDVHHLFAAVAGLRIFYQMRAQYNEARSMAEKLVKLTAGGSEVTGVISHEVRRRKTSAYQLLGTTLYYQGNLMASKAIHDRAFLLHGSDVGLFIFASLNLWLLGYPDQSRQRMLQAWLAAHQEQIPSRLGFAMANLARLNHLLRKSPQSQMWAQRAIALCSVAYEIPFWPMLGRLLLGNALAAQGQFAEGIRLIQQALRQADADQHYSYRTYFTCLLAEAHAYAGQYDKALANLDISMDYYQRNGERFWHAELVRLRGEYRLALGAPPAEVTACYQEAMMIAQGQPAKSLELRAAMSLARLYQQQGDRDAAYTTLSNVYSWFTEGFKTADLREAKALLAELAI